MVCNAVSWNVPSNSFESLPRWSGTKRFDESHDICANSTKRAWLWALAELVWCEWHAPVLCNNVAGGR